jgi:hypothetical protein
MYDSNLRIDRVTKCISKDIGATPAAPAIDETEVEYRLLDCEGNLLVSLDYDGINNLTKQLRNIFSNE